MLSGLLRLSLLGLGLVAVASCGNSKRGPQFRQIGPEVYSMIFSEGDDRAQVESAAREQCSGKHFCKVIGWSDPAFAASALPMTDREAAAQKFDYSVNRVTGLDEARWL